ncbi:hypothetical protein QAD02_004309 [Eretmocerus hayati]|uniref:Uncharacterized protein n=1 Tax=Eretmocerus hayati TaxID=131215 RepID=A0ACC2NQA0_9HYME|nr:hypothetical protein QAD02_004309 [Eretmocerus hayati]
MITMKILQSLFGFTIPVILLAAMVSSDPIMTDQPTAETQPSTETTTNYQGVDEDQNSTGNIEAELTTNSETLNPGDSTEVSHLSKDTLMFDEKSNLSGSSIPTFVKGPETIKDEPSNETTEVGSTTNPEISNTENSATANPGLNEPTQREVSVLPTSSETAPIDYTSTVEIQSSTEISEQDVNSDTVSSGNSTTLSTPVDSATGKSSETEGSSSSSSPASTTIDYPKAEENNLKDQSIAGKTEPQVNEVTESINPERATTTISSGTSETQSKENTSPAAPVTTSADYSKNDRNQIHGDSINQASTVNSGSSNSASESPQAAVPSLPTPNIGRNSAPNRKRGRSGFSIIEFEAPNPLDEPTAENDESAAENSVTNSSKSPNGCHSEDLAQHTFVEHDEPNKFCRWDNGIPHVFQCPEGTVFNYKSMLCLHY